MSQQPQSLLFRCDPPMAPSVAGPAVQRPSRAWQTAAALWGAAFLLHGCAQVSLAARPVAAAESTAPVPSSSHPETAATPHPASGAGAAPAPPAAGTPLGPESLTGRQWVVQQIATAGSQSMHGAGALSSLGHRVTLQFDGKGRVHGAGPCNGYSATYALTAEQLSIGPVMSTRRGCADDVMSIERALFRALESVVAFVVSPAGELTLVTREAAQRGETAGIVAH